MTRARATGIALLLSVACGGNPGPTLSEPVKATPLAGTVSGAPWTAVAAVASTRRAFSDGGSKWVDIADHAISCADFVPQADVFGVITWQPGGYDLSLAHNVTILERTDGGSPINDVAIIGRVELDSAPQDAGATAVLRLRARANASNSVEGQITVTVCD